MSASTQGMGYFPSEGRLLTSVGSRGAYGGTGARSRRLLPLRRPKPRHRARRSHRLARGAAQLLATVGLLLLASLTGIMAGELVDEFTVSNVNNALGDPVEVVARSFTGSLGPTTQNFRVQPDWKLRWHIPAEENGGLSMVIKTEAGSVVDTIRSSGPGSGSWHHSEGGLFSLEIESSTDHWTVQVIQIANKKE